MKQPLAKIGYTIFVRTFLNTLPRTLARAFTPRHLLWQLVAALITYALVTTDADWQYYVYFHGTKIYTYFFSAAIVGFIIPVLLPVTIVAIGHVRHKAQTVLLAWAVAQAEILGLVISSTYKAFTGRAHPMLFQQIVGTDTSKIFHFGFMDGGVFWGWPSSHTAVAFAVAGLVYTLYPKHRTSVLLALIYAFYVGIGVSMTIHWLSDFVAGAIIGTVIGVSVGYAWAPILRRKSGIVSR